MMVRWSGEVQVNVSGMSNLNLSLTLVVKLVLSLATHFLLKMKAFALIRETFQRVKFFRLKG